MAWPACASAQAAGPSGSAGAALARRRYPIAGVSPDRAQNAIVQPSSSTKTNAAQAIELRYLKP
jgi:hypothetical protein